MHIDIDSHCARIPGCTATSTDTCIRPCLTQRAAHTLWQACQAGQRTRASDIALSRRGMTRRDSAMAGGRWRALATADKGACGRALSARCAFDGSGLNMHFGMAAANDATPQCMLSCSSSSCSSSSSIASSSVSSCKSASPNTAMAKGIKTKRDLSFACVVGTTSRFKTTAIHLCTDSGTLVPIFKNFARRNLC